jgi:AcrR family transcriptional regulator
MSNSHIPPFDAQLAALDAFCEYLPAAMRRLVRERCQMGYEQYGDTWASRDNLAELLPELADAVVYLFQAVMRGESRRERAECVMLSLAEAWIRAIGTLPGRRTPALQHDQRTDWDGPASAVIDGANGTLSDWVRGQRKAGISYSEIAARVGVTPTAVRMHIARKGDAA